jgi:hypothetical protein
MADTCYEAILGALTVHQVLDAGFDPQAQVLKQRANGAVGPSQIVLDSARPVANLSTGDIASLVATSGFFNSGLNVTSGGITVPFIKRADGGLFAAGSSHNTVSGTSGLVIPTSLSVEHGSEQGLTCDLQVHFRSSDGRTTPFALNTSQALASASYVASYKMGPVVLNGSQVTRCLGYEVQTGLSVRAKAFCGNEYPTELLIEAESLDPMITVRFENFEALEAYGPLFANISDFACYARRCKDGGTTELDTAETHIKFSFSEGLAVNQGYSAQMQQDGQATMVLHGKSLTVAASAISLS